MEQGDFRPQVQNLNPFSLSFPVCWETALPRSDTIFHASLHSAIFYPLHTHHTETDIWKFCSTSFCKYMQLVWRALLSPHLPRCETKDTPCHAQDKPLGTGTHNFSNSLFRPQELSWKCRSRLVWQGVNNYTRGGMTHLNSIIQISYSCRNIIELLRGCYIHCRKGGGATKEKNAEITSPGGQVPKTKGGQCEQDTDLP